jgi:hypothetical protein
MGQGDIPTSPGGPLRRRREKRQLEHLAEVSVREVSPTTARAHVKVIEEQAVGTDRPPEGPDADVMSEPALEAHPGGFHVRAVPIDQPFGEA